MFRDEDIPGSHSDVVAEYYYKPEDAANFGMDRLVLQNRPFSGFEIYSSSGLVVNKALKKSKQYHVWLCLNGGCYKTIGQQQYRIYPNSMVFIPPHVLYSHQQEDVASFFGYYFLFSEEYYFRHQGSPFAFNGFPNIYTNGLSPCIGMDTDDTAVMKFLFELLDAERKKKRINNNEKITALISTILLKAEEIYHEKGNKPLLDHRHISITCKKFLELVAMHYINKKTVKEYAQMLFISSDHLSKMVRKHLHKEASSCIKEFEIAEAKTLLRYSGLTIQQIASRLNYESPSYFCKMFKRECGYTPADYKKHH